MVPNDMGFIAVQEEQRVSVVLVESRLKREQEMWFDAYP